MKDQLKYPNFWWVKGCVEKGDIRVVLNPGSLRTEELNMVRGMLMYLGWHALESYGENGLIEWVRPEGGES